ncbi:MAG: hypothetical protein ACK5L3_01350, partial [Oscillospiraceae bacterium]
TAGTESQGAVGAFREERELTADEKELFEKAVAELVGVKYEPIRVSTQVVNGTNYKFLCKGTAADANMTESEYYVTIYLPLGENAVPEITNIEEI